MGVKNTSIGQLLTIGAVGLVARQAYRYYKANGQSKLKANDQHELKDNKLDSMLEDTFPASDPLPLRSGSATI